MYLTVLGNEITLSGTILENLWPWQSIHIFNSVSDNLYTSTSMTMYMYMYLNYLIYAHLLPGQCTYIYGHDNLHIFTSMTIYITFTLDHDNVHLPDWQCTYMYTYFHDNAHKFTSMTIYIHLPLTLTMYIHLPQWQSTHIYVSDNLHTFIWMTVYTHLPSEQCTMYIYIYFRDSVHTFTSMTVESMCTYLQSMGRDWIATSI